MQSIVIKSEARATAHFQKCFKKITRRNRPMAEEILDTVKAVNGDPTIGKILTCDLIGFQSIPFCRGEMRLVYRVEASTGIVELHAVGQRKNAYADFARYMGRTMPYVQAKV